MEVELKQLLEVQELMIENQFISWEDNFSSFIGKLQEPKKEKMEKFARRCDVTGKGMNEGYLVFGDYAKDLLSADILAQKHGYNNFTEAHEEDENQDSCYWTEWDEIDEDDYYDADGNNYVDGELQ